jgi:hypothetical protein
MEGVDYSGGFRPTKLISVRLKQQRTMIGPRTALCRAVQMSTVSAGDFGRQIGRMCMSACAIPGAVHPDDASLSLLPASSLPVRLPGSGESA